MLQRMLFRVSVAEEADFRAAWAAEAPPGLKLYRALRGGRFAALPEDSPEEGVLLVAELGPDEWERWTRTFAGRQGFLGAWRLPGGIGVAHWSSPLMYQRAGAGVPGAALYVPD
jgi:hypothetical protein